MSIAPSSLFLLPSFLLLGTCVDTINPCWLICRFWINSKKCFQKTKLTFLLCKEGLIYIRFSNEIYCQVVAIPMGTNCATLVPDLFLHCFLSQFLAKFITIKILPNLIQKTHFIILNATLKIFLCWITLTFSNTMLKFTLSN